MGLIKKHNKQYREKLAGKLMALQDMIRLYAENSVGVILLFKLNTIKEQIEDADFKHVTFLTYKICERIKEDEAMLEKLAAVFSTEGLGHPIVKDDTNADIFIEACMEFITDGLITEILEGYDEKKENLENILAATRIMNSAAHEEEFTVVQ